MTTTLHNKPAILAHTCPGCRANPGDPCRSKMRRKTKPHVLRINVAKRAAAPGDCPACGMGLVITRDRLGSTITHTGTGSFGCGPTIDAFNDYLAGKANR